VLQKSYWRSCHPRLARTSNGKFDRALLLLLLLPLLLLLLALESQAVSAFLLGLLFFSQKAERREQRDSLFIDRHFEETAF